MPPSKRKRQAQPHDSLNPSNPNSTTTTAEEEASAEAESSQTPLVTTVDEPNNTEENDEQERRGMMSNAEHPYSPTQSPSPPPPLVTSDHLTNTPRRSNRRKMPKVQFSPEEQQNQQEAAYATTTTTTASTSTSVTTGIDTIVQSPARERFLRTRARGNKTLTPKQRSRKQKIVLEPLPSDIMNTKMINNSNAAPEVPDLALLSPKSRKAYDKNKTLPMKLRGKGTHGCILKKVNVSVVEGNASQEQIEQIQNTGSQFSKILSTQAKKFCVYEWFYPSIESAFWERNDFVSALHSLKMEEAAKGRIYRYELGAIRNEIAKHFKIRRFSKAFLQNESNMLQRYRDVVHAFYNGEYSPEHIELLKGYGGIPQRHSAGDRVYILDSDTYHVYPGTIQSVSLNSYTVSFDDESIQDRTVSDTYVMSLENVKLKRLHYSNTLNSPTTINSHHLPASPRTPLSKRKKLNVSGHSPSITSPPSFNLGSPITPTSSNHDIFSPSSHLNNSHLQSPQQTQLTHGIPFYLAQYICRLANKAVLMAELTSINTEAKLLLEQGHETLPQQLGQRCALVILKLKQVNEMLEQNWQMVLESYNKSFSEQRRSPGASNQQLQQQFQANRDLAKQQFNETSAQVQSELIKDLARGAQDGTHYQITAVQEKFVTFQKRIQPKVSDCIAFLLHLRSCIQDQTLTKEGIELILNAATMALKADSSEGAAVYREVHDLIQTLKERLL